MSVQVDEDWSHSSEHGQVSKVMVEKMTAKCYKLTAKISPRIYDDFVMRSLHWVPTLVDTLFSPPKALILIRSISVLNHPHMKNWHWKGW